MTVLHSTQKRSRLVSAACAALAVTGALLLSSCGSSEPLDSAPGNASADRDTIVIGSQDYYSNEIIAEIYAQALEVDDYSVDRQFRIGQREVYLPEIEAGKIDLFPEYTGNLLQFWEPDTTARLSDDVYSALTKATPKGLRVLDQSPATDQDSYTVTQDFADKWKLKTVADLSNVASPLTLGANSEAESRPYGPKGLADVYGIKDVGFTPIEDSGGPLTVKALKDDSIQLAIIYTADPTLSDNKLVSLKDTKGVFLASHVVPLASDRVDEKAAEIINKISAAMSPEDLIALNAASVNDEESASKIAQKWLSDNKLV
nr:ABC transporter substrate-binding protein [Leucobacter coleopterorum]